MPSSGPGMQVGAGRSEVTGTHLRSGEVDERGDGSAQTGGDRTHRVEPLEVFLRRAVAEVEPHDVGAGTHD